MSHYIGILQLKKELDDTVTGFKKGLSEAGVDLEATVFDYRNVEENVPSFGQEADDLIASGADLIFACTTPAAKFAKEATEFYEIPVVFAPVYDPVAAGLVDCWSGSGNHLAGVSGKVEVSEKLDLLQRLYPEVSDITVVYDPDDPNAPLEVADLEEAAKNRGLAITTLKVHEPKMLAELPVPAGCQVVYVPICRMLEDHINSLADYCADKRLLLFGPNIHTVKAGAFCCLDSLHYELGVLAGKIAGRILKGEEPGLIPISRPVKTQAFVNQKVARLLGISLAGLDDIQVV